MVPEHLLGGLSVHLGNHPLQHRRGFYLRDILVRQNNFDKFIALIVQDIEEEIGRGYRRQFFRNCGLHIRINLSDRRQNRQPQPQR